MKTIDRDTTGASLAGPALIVGAQHIAARRGETILRCLEREARERVAEGNYCSTGECLHCEVTVRRADGCERTVLACQQVVTDELSVVSLSRYLERDLRR